MGPDFPTMQELFNFYENVYPSGAVVHETELRSVSLRIPASSYEELERFAERWELSKSALAGLLLETALREIEFREDMQASEEFQKNASKAAL